MKEPAIRVAGLAKSYGALEAVGGIDLTVESGEIFAILGPNGAGKTTTVEILEGFVARSAGEVSVLGCDPAHNETSLKQRIGIVSQETVADPFLTVREMATMIAGTYPKPRPVDEIIALVGLSEKAGVRAGKLSGGQKRRLDVALALVGDPELVFLDEPTTGFDPDARREAWEMIAGLRALGKTVVLTTHYMDEAERLADRIAVIVGGKIIAQGSPHTLGGRSEAGASIRFRAAGPPLPEALSRLITSRRGDATELSADDPVRTLHELTGWAIDQGVALEALEVSRPSLEDAYLSLIAGAAKRGGGA
jgi:ABC-2 type transport system ATP-binding protein